jgi:ankyrin repeat protein
MDAILENYSYDQEYECSHTTKCTGFSKLMFLIGKVSEGALINHANTLSLDEINHQNDDQWAVLHIICRNNRKYQLYKLLELLIQKGANINAQTNTGATPLHFAVRHSNVDSTIGTVKLLIKYEANVNIRDFENGFTPLFLALYYKTSSLETLILLLDNGADTNIKDHYGDSALYVALSPGIKITLPRLLIKYGANVI